MVLSGVVCIPPSLEVVLAFSVAGVVEPPSPLAGPSVLSLPLPVVLVSSLLPVEVPVASSLAELVVVASTLPELVVVASLFPELVVVPSTLVRGVESERLVGHWGTAQVLVILGRRAGPWLLVEVTLSTDKPGRSQERCQRCGFERRHRDARVASGASPTLKEKRNEEEE